MGAQEKSPTAKHSMQRVKVYRLSGDGKWDDQGTGHVTVDYLERSEELGLFVVDEEDNETLLLHRISSDDIYRKQEDTIISWRDPEFSTELALSFQETTGCSYIWDNICSVQRNMHFNTLNTETYHSVNSELRELPAVELSTLPIILKTVVESGIADQMRVTELILHDQDFFRKLMDLFGICEDLDNIDGLHMIFKIVRGIILFNSPQIFETIFADELVMDIIGCLEYDPDIHDVQRHRSFLKEYVVFKEAIPIKDPQVLSKIHQTYRVGYLKDVILPRVLDDATLANLNSIIHSNNAMVVSLLKDDNTFIQELFARLRLSTTSAESKKNLVLFLHEFCSLTKSLQMIQQQRLFRDLVNEGLFDIVVDVLQSQDKKLVLIGTDILILFLNQDPNLLRSYVTRQEGVTLFGLLVKGMITDFGDDMHCQFLEILRNLLDSYTSGSQRDTIIEIFYEKHLGQLIDVITSSCPPNSIDQSVSKSVGFGSAENEIRAKPEILLNICELLCFCVLHHLHRIKCNFLLHNVIDKVLFLTHRKEKYLVLAAVRFFRTVISRSTQMNELAEHMEGSSTDPAALQEQIFTQVMGPERPGRVRTFGLGPSPTDVFGGGYRRSQEQNRLFQTQVQEQVQEQLQRYQMQFESKMNEVMEKQIQAIRTDFQSRIQFLESQLQAAGVPVDPVVAPSNPLHRQQVVDSRSSHPTIRPMSHQQQSHAFSSQEVHLSKKEKKNKKKKKK